MALLQPTALSPERWERGRGAEPGVPRGWRWRRFPRRGVPGGAERGWRAGAGGGSRSGGRAPAPVPASPLRRSAFRMKSGLNAGGFAGAEHVRDVSRAKCRREALVAQ